MSKATGRVTESCAEFVEACWMVVHGMVTKGPARPASAQSKYSSVYIGGVASWTVCTALGTSDCLSDRTEA